MLRTPLRISVLLVAVAGLMLAQAGIASAHNVQHASTTTMFFKDFPSATGDNFRGKVSSTNACTNNRNVRVYRGNAGGRVLVGSTTTNVNGVWSVPSEDPLTTSPTDAFWARVTQKVLANNGSHNHVCKPTTSSAISGFSDA